MKTVRLKEELVIAGETRTPDDEPITLENDSADTLIEAGMVEEVDTLDGMKLDELKALAASESVTLDGATKKAEIAAAIRAHRVSASA